MTCTHAHIYLNVICRSETNKPETSDVKRSSVQRKSAVNVVINKMFPTMATSTGIRRGRTHPDVCICIDSSCTCTCNDGLAFTEEDVEYDRVSEISIGEYCVGLTDESGLYLLRQFPPASKTVTVITIIMKMW